tara:strand:- start:13833 stop:14426 length:594 start_codon:yes stop_codon:yes gene_type:complete
MQAFAYYPSFIYREERPQWVEETLKHTQKYYDKTKEWLPEDAVVKQTQPMVEDKELQYLSSYFIDKSVSILKDQGYLTDEYEFYLSAMWGQEFACTGSNVMHVHNDSQISGFYFLETPENGSFPIFDDPRPGKKMTDLLSVNAEQVNAATANIYFNNVTPGTMLFFNSWLPHMITPNNDTNPTKFIHFLTSQRKRFI